MRLVVAACLLSCASPALARAQAIEVAPVSIVFYPEQRTASLTLTNRSTTPMVIQVRPFIWQETNDTPTLTETSALAVSPPFAEVAPGQAQSIRLLLRTSPGAAEATYRLLVDQLPPPGTPGVIRVAVRLSLPVFAQPSTQAAAALTWEILQSRSGAVLEVHNRGNRHATILGVQLSPRGGPSIPVRTSAHPYVLSGSATQWPIGAQVPGGGGPVRLMVTSDTGALEAMAPIVSAPP